MQVLIQSIIFNSLFSDVEKADRIADVIANHYTLNSDIPQATLEDKALSFGDALKIVIDEIAQNEYLYYAYQSNIAMPFQDALLRECPSHLKGQIFFKQDNINRIANEAAKYFIDLWINQSDKKSQVDLLQFGRVFNDTITADNYGSSKSMGITTILDKLTLNPVKDNNVITLHKEVYEEMERRYKVYEELVEEARSCFANLKAHSTECEGILINSNADIIDTVNEWMDNLYEQVTIKDQGITPDGKADANPKPKVSLPLTEELSQNSFKMEGIDFTDKARMMVEDYFKKQPSQSIIRFDNVLIRSFSQFVTDNYCVYTVKENIQNNADQYRKGREHVETQLKAREQSNAKLEFELKDTIRKLETAHAALESQSEILRQYQELASIARDVLNQVAITSHKENNTYKYVSLGLEVEPLPFNEWREKHHEFYRLYKVYTNNYSDKSEEPKNRDVLKSSSRVGVKDLDFLAYLDLYAREEHEVEDWYTLSRKLSPEALNEVYKKAVGMYNQYLRLNYGK